MVDESTVWIVTEVEVTETTETTEVQRGGRGSEDTGGGFGQRVKERVTTLVRKPVAVPKEVLKRQMKGLLQVVTELFNQSQVDPDQVELDQANPAQASLANPPGMVLDEVELSIEVNGEGQISIVGNSAKTGQKGAIKLKFKRVSPTDG
ncbi:MAG: hypothetical protein KME15_17370 [Drouetiella hepatica Uher 2000/2452]|jgi:hypothetical protein|uniref:Pepco domain-containing protein n=1 Tax=Drouetiella hepatica Uher 2000/2452 TaxID=904376 RepID=A0A951QCX1_9CYAN|nr:hypothetical protein [Drouetiella hepatica Uher 2000/2452]